MVSVTVDNKKSDEQGKSTCSVQVSSKTTIFELSSEIAQSCDGLLEQYYKILMAQEQKGKIKPGKSDELFDAVFDHVAETQSKMRKAMRRKRSTVAVQEVTPVRKLGY